MDPGRLVGLVGLADLDLHCRLRPCRHCHRLHLHRCHRYRLHCCYGAPTKPITEMALQPAQAGAHGPGCSRGVKPGFPGRPRRPL